MNWEYLFIEITIASFVISYVWQLGRDDVHVLNTYPRLAQVHTRVHTQVHAEVLR